MSCSTLGPQFAMMAGPTGREGGDVMRPWPKTEGTARASNEAVVKCIFCFNVCVQYLTKMPKKNIS